MYAECLGKKIKLKGLLKSLYYCSKLFIYTLVNTIFKRTAKSLHPNRFLNVYRGESVINRAFASKIIIPTVGLNIQNRANENKLPVYFSVLNRRSPRVAWCSLGRQASG